jgi:hypothetical protein
MPSLIGHPCALSRSRSGSPASTKTSATGTRRWRASIAGAGVRAEQAHLEAAAAHEAAMAAPLDQARAAAAMRACGFADQSSQQAGVRPMRPWPKRLATGAEKCWGTHSAPA